MTTRWRSFLYGLAGRLPSRIIKTEEGALFERYFLFSIFGVTAYLHHYLMSDPDRGHHNHPWRHALVIPIAGGYVETRLHMNYDETRIVRRLRRPGIPYLMGPKTKHRIMTREINGRPITNWSLFFHSRKSREWGFFKETDRAPFGVPSVTYNMSDSKTLVLDSDGWWRTAPLGRHRFRAVP